MDPGCPLDPFSGKHLQPPEQSRPLHGPLYTLLPALAVLVQSANANSTATHRIFASLCRLRGDAYVSLLASPLRSRRRFSSLPLLLSD